MSDAPTPAKADETTDLRDSLATAFERRFPLTRWQAEAHAEGFLKGPLAQREAAHAAEIQALRAERDETLDDKEFMTVDLSRQTLAAEARADRLAAENAVLVKAIRPFTELWFSFDGFSCDPATLVFRHREYGEWRSDHHAAFDEMIRAARAALPEAITPKDDG